MFSKRELLILITIVLAIIISSLVLVLLGIKAAFLSLLLVLITVIFYRFPRTSLYLFLIYLCFGGTITYSIPGIYYKVEGGIVFSKFSPIFHFIKDAFYLPALLSILINSRQTLREIFTRAKPLLWPILGLTAICLITMLLVNLPAQFNFGSGQNLAILMGMIGLKIWLGYIPLIICGFYLIRDRQDLLKFNRLLVVLIIICCLLCLLQYYALISGICDGSVGLPRPAFHKASLQARCLVGGSLLYNPELGLIRLPGTFVAPWQWGWFLISSIFLAVASAQSEKQKIWNYLSWFASFLVLISAVISGQRIALLLVPVFFLILVIVTESKSRKFPIKLAMISFLGVISYSLPIVQKSINSFIARWNYTPPQDFTIETLQFVISNQDGILGNGLGTTASAARKLGQIQLIEIFHGKLIYEMGFLGLISFMILVSVLVFLTWKIQASLEDKSLKNMAICFWIFILFISYNFYYYPLNVDPVNVYFWLIAGVLFRLPDLDNQRPES